MDYKTAGVDVQANAAWVDQLQPLVEQTYQYGDVRNPKSGFAGACQLGGETLFACVDGVGSKARLAMEIDKLNTIGIDLVAMNVNDLAACNAEPLFFLDYLGINSFDKLDLQAILKGVVKGCHQARCVLLGGETAEMPLTYSRGDLELVGCAVGRGYHEQGPTNLDNTIIVGYPSSGLHSNGYTLIHKLRDVESFGGKWDTHLLEPTKIYTELIREKHGIIRAAAHITGGGLAENIKRTIGDHGAKIFPKKWAESRPVIFNALEQCLTQEVLYSTFNMGIGFVIIAAPDDVEELGGIEIGHITASGNVEIEL